jgi:prepilin-type N-terminal cleavage/methylation domain-containing protein
MKKSHKKIYPQVSGFTLVEILVVVAITTVLTGVGVANYQDIRQVNQVVADANEAMIAIREVQNKALAPNPLELGLPVDEELCAYGVYFDEVSSDIVLYYSSINTTIINSCQEAGSAFSYDPANEYDRVSLLHTDLNLSSGTTLSLWYETPFARAGTLPSVGTSFTLTIEHQSDATKSRTIEVPESGMVSTVD